MRILSLLTLGLLCLTTAAWAGLPPELQTLIDEGLANNPELQAAHSRWQMFAQKAPQVSAWDDPQLSFSFSNYPVDSLRADESPMTANEFRLAQKFPFPGKLGSKEESARQQARWYEGVWRDGRLQLAQKIADNWFRLYALERSASILEENLALVASMTRLAESRYSVGKGMQQDVLKLQVEQGRMQDRLEQLRQQAHSTRALLASLLGRPQAGDGIVAAERLPVSDVPPEDDLRLLAQRRPLFQAYDGLIESYAAQERLAELNYYPDLTAFVGYRFREEIPGRDEGTDQVSAGVTINLPIWRKNRQAAVAEAVSGQSMAQAQRHQFAVDLEARLADSYRQYERSTAQLQLVQQGVLPQARQAFEAALAGYQVGKVDVLSVIDSLRILYGYQMDEARYQSEHEQAAAQVRALAGTLIDTKD